MNCRLNKNIGFRIVLKVKFEQKNKILTQHMWYSSFKSYQGNDQKK